MMKNWDIKENYIFHRGLYDTEYGIPENSMAAFRKALIKKYAIELDVRLSKDNIVVVFHDSNTFRMTGYNASIEKLEFSTIKRLNLKNTVYTIPTLTDVLNLVKGEVWLDIELKGNILPHRLEKEVIKLLDKYPGKFSIKSFNPLSIFNIKNAVEIILGEYLYLGTSQIL